MRRLLTIAGFLLLAAAAPAWADSTGPAVTPPEAGGYYHVPVVTYRDMPFRTVVRQQYDFSCGSAAVATLLRYHYGRAVDETTVFKAMYAVGNQQAIKAHGFSLADIQSYLKSVGFRSDGYRVSFDVYAKARIPALAIIKIGQYKHFVVIKGVDNGYVLIGDPASGIKSMSMSEFMKVWDGLVFIIHDENHPSDRHNFSTKAEWIQIHHPPLEPTTHSGPMISDLTELQHGTIFEVLNPNIVNTNITFMTAPQP